MKTKYHIKFREYFQIYIYSNFKRKIFFILGKIINDLLQIHKDYLKQSTVSNKVYVQKISKERLDGMYEPKGKYDLSLEHDYGGIITEDVVKNTELYRINTYLLSAKLLENFINKNQNQIKKVVQIGCGSLDVINDYLSSQFKDINFISNDLFIDLEEMHLGKFPNYLNKKNWQCVQGYQIDLMNENKLGGDLFIMKSMLCGHSLSEINELFSLYKAKKVKYIFLTEQWNPKIKSFNFFKLDRPENVQIDKPYVSGYIHYNYIELLKKHGFEIVSSDIYVNENIKQEGINTKGCNLYLFAKNVSK